MGDSLVFVVINGDKLVLADMERVVPVDVGCAVVSGVFPDVVVGGALLVVACGEEHVVAGRFGDIEVCRGVDVVSSVHDDVVFGV